jgi:hypothetical protein
MSNFLIQSSFGTAGNFEAVVPGGGGLVHLWRNNDDPTLPWAADAPFGTNLEAITGVALIQSNTATPGATPGAPGNFELIVVADGALLHFVRDSVTFTWIQDPNPIATGVFGWPAIIQSSFGTVGNFEVVVPSSNGLLHFWRNNDVANNPPWSTPTPFGGINGISSQYQGVSLIQSSFGNLEVVATPALTFAQEAAHFWRDGANWTYTASFGDGITGPPSLIQSNFGSIGDFEVVAPFNSTQAIAHNWRNNNAAGFPWAQTGSFAAPGGAAGLGYRSVALIQSRIDNSLVAAAYRLDGNGLDIYVRTGAAFVLSTTAAL